jgi:hypothetical protein
VRHRVVVAPDDAVAAAHDERLGLVPQPFNDDAMAARRLGARHAAVPRESRGGTDQREEATALGARCLPGVAAECLRPHVSSS